MKLIQQIILFHQIIQIVIKTIQTMNIFLKTYQIEMKHQMTIALFLKMILIGTGGINPTHFLKINQVSMKLIKTMKHFL